VDLELIEAIERDIVEQVWLRQYKGVVVVADHIFDVALIRNAGCKCWLGSDS